MKDNKAIRCFTCVFWRELPPGRRQFSRGKDGECRRYPPTVIDLQNMGDVPISTTPLTAADHWCGEWRLPGGDG